MLDFFFITRNQNKKQEAFNTLFSWNRCVGALKYIEITLTKSYFSKVRCIFSKESYNNWFITHDVDVGDNDDLDGGDGGDGEDNGDVDDDVDGDVS